MSNWETINHQTSVDVVPMDDAKEHGYGDECWCKPDVETTEGVALITHNEENHEWGEWQDAEPMEIGGKIKILSMRHCRSCGKSQTRIGHVV